MRDSSPTSLVMGANHTHHDHRSTVYVRNMQDAACRMMNKMTLFSAPHRDLTFASIQHDLTNISWLRQMSRIMLTSCLITVFPVSKHQDTKVYRGSETEATGILDTSSQLHIQTALCPG
jgi:hypothetical protein